MRNKTKNIQRKKWKKKEEIPQKPYLIGRN